MGLLSIFENFLLTSYQSAIKLEQGTSGDKRLLRQNSSCQHEQQPKIARSINKRTTKIYVCRGGKQYKKSVHSSSSR